MHSIATGVREEIFSLTTRGTTVIVTDEKRTEPTISAHPGIVLMSDDSQSDVAHSLKGDFDWDPERSPEGPITILASGADKTVYVYRNGISIGCATFQIENPRRRLGAHAFTMLEGLADAESTFVPGRPAHRWMAVRTEGKATLDDLGRRIRVSPAFAEKVYDIISPGTTIVITDAPALHPSPSTHAVFRMESAPR